MNIVFWTVTTAIIKQDWDYILHVESNSSDIEYKNCSYLVQPWVTTFPKVWSTVLVAILTKLEYVVLWVIADKISESWVIISSNSIKLIWDSITANWENLIIDNT